MYKDIGRITRSYIYSERRFCPDNVSTMSKPKSEAKEKTDPRLKNHSFKVAVREVLADLGLESTMGNFRKYQHKIDWEIYARNLKRNPVQGIAQISKTVFIKVRAETESKAIKLLTSRGFKFDGWCDLEAEKKRCDKTDIITVNHLPEEY